MNKTKVKYY